MFVDWFKNLWAQILCMYMKFTLQRFINSILIIVTITIQLVNKNFSKLEKSSGGVMAGLRLRSKRVRTLIML